MMTKTTLINRYAEWHNRQDDLGGFMGSDVRGGLGADAKKLTILFE